MLIGLTLLASGLTRSSVKMGKGDAVSIVTYLMIDVVLVTFIAYVLYAGGFW